MKILKISLVIIVVVAIGAGIFFWRQSTIPPPTVKPPENAFIKKVQEEIEKLKAMPDNKFCKDYYNEVAFHINDFHKQGRFGKNEFENKQWKENLESNLFSAYSEKFIKQAYMIFMGSEWKPADLRFIQTEKNLLKGSKFLVAGSTVDKEFTTIQNALNKYNAIVTYISSCNSYSYSLTDLSARFPIEDVKDKISQAESLRRNGLENNYVNNCTRLHNGLKEIRQSLFKKHILYLDNKINHWSGKYSYYTSQKDYANILYQPLRAEIDALDNDVYNVSSFDSEYNRLTQKLNADSQSASAFFNNKQ